MADEKFDEVPEGIVNLKDDFGRTFYRALSTTSIEVMDLICEGEIEGPLEGTYTYQGNLYDIGYTNATFVPYNELPNGEAKWLKSVYWNDVPIVSSDNKYNFQKIVHLKAN